MKLACLHRVQIWPTIHSGPITFRGGSNEGEPNGSEASRIPASIEISIKLVFLSEASTAKQDHDFFSHDTIQTGDNGHLV